MSPFLCSGPQIEAINVCNALGGAYQGALTFDVDGADVIANSADEIALLPKGAALLNTQSDDLVPFIFCAIAKAVEPRLTAPPLAPTVVLEKDGTVLNAFAFEQPITVAQADIFSAFEPLDGTFPLPATDGWTLRGCDINTFYSYNDLAATFTGISLKKIGGPERSVDRAPLKSQVFSGGIRRQGCV